MEGEREGFGGTPGRADQRLNHSQGFLSEQEQSSTPLLLKQEPYLEGSFVFKCCFSYVFLTGNLYF